MALDDTPREAVRDGIPELDAHHFGTRQAVRA
jgi:hypothetical protein